MQVPTALLAPAAIAALACAGADTARPAVVPAAPARRVVLLSLDGFAAGRHLENLRAGIYADPDGVAAFADSFVAERAIPVNPTLTAPSHAAIATGAFPAVTGIVANVFRLPGAPIGQETSGFKAPWGAESLWEAFRRQGKRVGVLGFPGCDGTAPSRTADFGATYVNTPFARARTLTFAAARFTTVTLPPGWTSDSPARRATFSVDLAGAGLPAAATFTLTALDSSDDGVVAYDTLVADDDADLANGVLARVHAGEWFPLRLRAPHPDGGSRTVGGWCVLQALPADLDGVTVYRGGFYAAEAYPRAFREALEAGAGFWPGPPDEYVPDWREAKPRGDHRRGDARPDAAFLRVLHRLRHNRDRPRTVRPAPSLPADRGRGRAPVPPRRPEAVQLHAGARRGRPRDGHRGVPGRGPRRRRAGARPRPHPRRARRRLRPRHGAGVGERRGQPAPAARRPRRRREGRRRLARRAVGRGWWRTRAAAARTCTSTSRGATRAAWSTRPR